MIDLFTHLPTTAYPPGTMGVTASPELTPSGNHVAMASPTSRPNAAPEDEKSDTDV